MRLGATPWAVAHQPPLSVGFLREEPGSVFQFPSPGNLPDPGIEPLSPALAGLFFTAELPGNPIPLLIVSQVEVLYFTAQ